MVLGLFFLLHSIFLWYNGFIENNEGLTMPKQTIDVSKIVSQLDEKTVEINKIDELIAREKKESCIETFKVARKIAFKELKKLQKIVQNQLAAWVAAFTF